MNILSSTTARRSGMRWAWRPRSGRDHPRGGSAVMSLRMLSDYDYARSPAGRERPHDGLRDGLDHPPLERAAAHSRSSSSRLATRARGAGTAGRRRLHPVPVDTTSAPKVAVFVSSRADPGGQRLADPLRRTRPTAPRRSCLAVHEREHRGVLLEDVARAAAASSTTSRCASRRASADRRSSRATRGNRGALRGAQAEHRRST